MVIISIKHLHMSTACSTSLLHCNSRWRAHVSSTRCEQRRHKRRGKRIACNARLRTISAGLLKQVFEGSGPTWCTELTAPKCGGPVFRSAYRWREHLKWKSKLEQKTQGVQKKKKQPFNYPESCSRMKSHHHININMNRSISPSFCLCWSSLSCRALKEWKSLPTALKSSRSLNSLSVPRAAIRCWGFILAI